MGPVFFHNAESRGPQQVEILDTYGEIRAEILLEIRDPKSQPILFPIISVKYGNLYHMNCNVRPRATMARTMVTWMARWMVNCFIKGWWLRGTIVSLVD